MLFHCVLRKSADSHHSLSHSKTMYSFCEINKHFVRQAKSLLIDFLGVTSEKSHVSSLVFLFKRYLNYTFYRFDLSSLEEEI